jgi:hypothetical protein
MEIERSNTHQTREKRALFIQRVRRDKEASANPLVHEQKSNASDWKTKSAMSSEADSPVA